MIPLDELLVLALASFRLTRLVTTDQLSAQLRERVWARRPPESSRLGYLLTCDWCVSIWTSALLVLVYSISSTTALAVGAVLALSAAASIVAARVRD